MKSKVKNHVINDQSSPITQMNQQNKHTLTFKRYVLATPTSWSSKSKRLFGYKITPLKGRCHACRTFNLINNTSKYNISYKSTRVHDVIHGVSMHLHVFTSILATRILRMTQFLPWKEPVRVQVNRFRHTR